MPVVTARCSAKSCDVDAAFAVIWNNPKLHTPDREKRWVACESHRQYLADFLDRRGFLIRVDALPRVEPLPAERPDVEPVAAPQVPGRTAPA